MMLITIARKPVALSIVSTVLRWGTGGLNIDATRLFCGTNHMRGVVRGMTVGGMTGGDERTGKALGRFEPGRAFQATDHPGGRWPANLILQHDPECYCTGPQKIKAVDARRNPARQTGAFFGGTTQHIVGPRCYPDADGTETVNGWECVEGCPVKELDGQSGFQHSRGNVSPTTQGGGSPVALGAARFFKQVKL